MKKKLRIIIPLLAALAVAIVLIARIGPEEEPAGIIPGNGTIEATEVDVSSKVAGKILSLAVKEGDTVTEGQLIAVLDSGELSGQAESARGNLEAAQAALAELEAGARAEEIRRLRAQRAAAAETRAQAQERLDLLRAGARPEQIAQLRAAYQQAQQRLALVQEGPRQEEIAQLRAQYDAAQARLALISEGPRKEEIAQLRAQYEAAQARLSLVKEGPRPEVLAQLRANLTQAKVNLDDAERELARAKDLFDNGALPRQQVDLATTRRDNMKQLATMAQEKLNEAQAGARPQEIREVEQAVEAAKQRLAAAQTGARPQEIQEVTQTVEAAKQRLQAAQAGARPQEREEAAQLVEIARQRLLEAERGARPQEIAQAAAQVKQAGAQVEAAQAALDLALAGPRRETLAAARARVAQAHGALATAQAAQGQTTIFAPAGGRVTLRNVEPGELVTPGMPIVRVAMLHDVWLRVFVPEPQLRRVRLGQTAQVTTDGAGRRYAGRVVEIADEAEFTPKNVQTKGERVKLVYAVKVAVDNTDNGLKPGMPADALIDVGAAE